MIYVEKGNEGYKIDEKDLGEYKARGFEVPGEKQEEAAVSPDDPNDDKKKGGQK